MKFSFLSAGIDGANSTAIEKKDSAKKSRGASTLSLVVDIESGVIRAALVLNATGEIPRIMFAASSPIVLKTAAGMEGLLETMIKSLNEVTHAIAASALPGLHAKGISLPIRSVSCVLSSPWVISKTKTVKIDYEKDTQISKETVDGIIDAEHQEFEKRFKLEHDASTEGAALEYDLVFIEQKIFEIKLNGYPVTDVHKKRAREIEISFAVSLSSKDILDKIKEAIAGNLNIKEEQYRSSLLLQYAAFRNLVPNRNDYIAVHIHNHISDIVVVRQGVSSVLASFPSGTSSFLGKTAKSLNQPESLARSALVLNAEEKISSDHKEEISRATDPAMQDWASQFFQTLSLASDFKNLPRIVILSTREHFSYFQQALENEEWGKLLTVIPLSQDLLDKAVSYDRGQDTDALLRMYALALDQNTHADW